MCGEGACACAGASARGSEVYEGRCRWTEIRKRRAEGEGAWQRRGTSVGDRGFLGSPATSRTVGGGCKEGPERPCHRQRRVEEERGGSGTRGKCIKKTGAGVSGEVTGQRVCEG